MSRNLRTYTAVVFGFEHVVRQVGDRWDAPTPCAEWDIRQVTGHTIGVISNVAARAGVGVIVDQFGDVAALAGDDPPASFRAARDRYLEAIDRPGALATPVMSRLGTMTLDRYIAVMACDTLVHTWDLLVALDLPIALEPTLVRFVRDEYRIRDEATMRGPAMYAAPLAQQLDAELDTGLDADTDTDTDTDLAEVLAYTGRTPC